MRTANILSTVMLAILGCFLGCIFTQPACAQAPNRSINHQANNEAWQFRFDLFQMLLEQNGLEPIGESESFVAPGRPINNLVVISLGMQDRNPTLQLVRKFATSGKVLIATDRAVRFDELFLIQDGPVESLSSQDSYQEFRDCIIAADFPKDDALTGEISQLIVNRGGWIAGLSNRYGTWQIHGRYPRRVRPLASARKPFLASMTLHAFDQPTLTIASDHSLLSNGMIWHGDNAMLAIELSRQLAADLNGVGNSGNKKMLFLVDGQAMPSYTKRAQQEPADQSIPPIPPIDEIPPEAIPEPTLDQMLKVANRVVSKVEDSDLINEFVSNQPRRIREPYFRRLLLILGSLFVLTYAIYRLSRPPAIATPASTTLAVGPPPIDTSKDFATAEQRGVAARYLARDFFIEQTGSTDARKWREMFSVGSYAGAESLQKKSSKTKTKLPKSFRKSPAINQLDSIGYLIAVADSQHAPMLTTNQLTSFGIELETLRNRVSAQPQATKKTEASKVSV